MQPERRLEERIARPGLKVWCRPVPRVPSLCGEPPHNIVSALLDVGTRGARLVLTQHVPPHDLLCVELGESEFGTVRASAEVRWIRPSGHAFCAGVQFMRSPRVLELLARLVTAQRLRHGGPCHDR